jgi:hypothetical protein
VIPEPPTIVVGLLTDPSLPADVARKAAQRLPQALDERVDGRFHWVVRVHAEPVEAVADHDRLMDKARARVDGTGWDMAVCLVDLPVTTSNGVLAAAVDLRHRTALCSLPALGGLALRRRTVDLIAALVAELLPLLHGPATAVGADRPRRDRAHGRSIRALRRVAPSDDDVDIELTVRRGGRGRLLAGLVRTARPWRLALGLSKPLAAAATGSAFGLLYTSIWSLGAALGPVRLTAACAGSVALLIVWLVFGHGLWESRAAAGGHARLLNVATLITTGLGALLFATALFAMNVLAALVVVPPDLLSRTIGEPVGLTEFLRVPLMATVLGIVAGAVGAGLEDDSAVRNAAYSHREQSRQRLMRDSRPTEPSAAVRD